MYGNNYQFKVFKTGFNSFLKHIDNNHLLIDLHLKLTEINYVVYHTYAFIKVYFLYLTENSLPYPVLDRDFINLCFKLFFSSKKKETKMTLDNKTTLQTLSDFFHSFYLPKFSSEIKILQNCVHLTPFLRYEAIDMIKNYENMIKFTFIDKLNRYIDNQYKLHTLSGTEKNLLRSKLRTVKDDICELREYQSDPEYHPFIDSLRLQIYPFDRVIKNSLHYDIVVYPIDYLRAALNLGLNILPLKRSFIPGYITVDNELLQRLTKTSKIPFPEIWNMYFNLDMKQTKKYVNQGYEFFMLKTDLVGASLMFRKKISKRNKPSKCTEKYIDSEDFLNIKVNRNIVGIDPGKSDLIYCTDGQNRFRYSQVQRNKETEKNKNRKYSERLKKDTICNDEADSIKDIESGLSQYRSDTSDLDEFIEYITNKNRDEETMREFYSLTYFRKYKWKTHILGQKSESKMIRNFKNKFGDQNSSVLVFGDWESKRKMKCGEPTLGKGMREIFRRSGYKVFLAYEAYTSCMCYQCEGRNEKCEYRNDPRPWKGGQRVKVHGLLKCTTCKRYWNRDFCGSLNIRQLGISAPERPEYLSHNHNIIQSKSEAENVDPSNNLDV